MPSVAVRRRSRALLLRYRTVRPVAQLFARKPMAPSMVLHCLTLGSQTPFVALASGCRQSPRAGALERGYYRPEGGFPPRLRSTSQGPTTDRPAHLLGGPYCAVDRLVGHLLLAAAPVTASTRRRTNPQRALALSKRLAASEPPFRSSAILADTIALQANASVPTERHPNTTQSSGPDASAPTAPSFRYSPRIIAGSALSEPRPATPSERRAASELFC